MKLNIKGLVFVGFAAAVFANAAAFAEEGDNKKVTSKQFTEATYVKKNADITGATKTKITYDAKGLVTAGADLEASDIPDISATYQLKSERVNNLDNPSNSTYPTTQAVADALTTTGNSIGNGTISVTQNGASAGSFTTNQNTAGSVTIVAPDWNAAAGTQGEILNKPTIPDVYNATLTVKQGTETLGTFTANSNTPTEIDIPVPTAPNNATISVTQNGANAGSFTTDQATAGSITIVAPDWNAAAGTQGEILNKPAINDGTLTIQKNGASVGTFTANSASGSTINIEVPTTPDIPTPASGTCTAEAPCALVWAGGTTPTWEPIQQ